VQDPKKYHHFAKTAQLHYHSRCNSKNGVLCSFRV